MGRKMAIPISNRRSGGDGQETEHLLARLELIAGAEEQAASAEEQAWMAAQLGDEALSCAPVLTLAIEQVTSTHADLCERMAAAASAEGEVLLARALHSLA